MLLATTIISITSLVLVLIVLISTRKQKGKKEVSDLWRIFKGIALMTPLTLSLTLLMFMVTNVFGGNFSSKPSPTENISIGLGILGVAVTVWVGLSIYNVIEKKHVDALEESVKEQIKILEDHSVKIAEQEYRYSFLDLQTTYTLTRERLRDYNTNASNEHYTTIIERLEALLFTYLKLLNVNEKLSKKEDINFTSFIGYFFGTLRRITADILPSWEPILEAKMEGDRDDIEAEKIGQNYSLNLICKLVEESDAIYKFKSQIIESTEKIQPEWKKEMLRADLTNDIHVILNFLKSSKEKIDKGFTTMEPDKMPPIEVYDSFYERINRLLSNHKYQLESISEAAISKQKYENS